MIRSESDFLDIVVVVVVVVAVVVVVFVVVVVLALLTRIISTWSEDRLQSLWSE